MAVCLHIFQKKKNNVIYNSSVFVMGFFQILLSPKLYQLEKMYPFFQEQMKRQISDITPYSLKMKMQLLFLNQLESWPPWCLFPGAVPRLHWDMVYASVVGYSCQLRFMSLLPSFNNER